MVGSVRDLDIVWFIGVMCVVQTLAQVCPYTDPKCQCRNDSITCHFLEQMPPLNTGANVRHVANLIFQNGNINSIANNNLPPGLTSLELSGQPLKNISDDVFDTSVTTLRRVIIASAKFDSLPLALKKLTSLTELSIFFTSVADWNIAILRQIAATLQSLELQDVSLSSWPSWMSFFHLLRSINLSINPIKVIPDNAFIFIKDSLTTLQLAHTGLTHLPQALSLLTNLTNLGLEGNSINVSEVEKITTLPFAGKLEYLSLGSLLLPRIANVSKLTSLKSLDFTNNRISDLSAGSLPTSLTTLSLAFNSLISIPHELANLPRLSSLDLSGNLITWIEPNSFPSSLTYLMLYSNNITTIANSPFRNLNLLRKLDLSFNPFATISPSAFSDLVSLRSLKLDLSYLTEIPLAFTLLNPQVDLDWTPIQPLSCPCPAPQELVQWFTAWVYQSLGLLRCSNGQLVDSYLTGQCA